MSKKVIVCAVGECPNSSSANPELSYHRFPLDKKLRQVSIIKTYQKDKFNPDNSRICSRHFAAKDFHRDLRAELLALENKSRDVVFFEGIVTVVRRVVLTKCYRYIRRHPTSCASIAEIMSVLFFNELKLDINSPLHKSSDRFVLSKGHSAPILYAAWAELGLFPVSELEKLRRLDSDLEGHPTPRLNFIDVGTGSLGQGLSVGCGMAYVGKYYDKASYRVYVLVGDGESAEGSVWEALHFAGHYNLDNLCLIIDVNRLGQSEATSLQHQMEVYQKRVEAFGWNAIVVDGHDISQLLKGFELAAATKGKPTCLIAKTYKGKGFPEIEDSPVWHGKPLGPKGEPIIKLLSSKLKNPGPYAGLGSGVGQVKDDAPEVQISGIKLSEPPSYKLGEQIATRLAYGQALASLAKSNSRVIALDGDTKNSTFSDKIKSVNPGQHIECYIAEQNLAGVAIGAACRDRAVVFASAFATFFTRAYDQIRMGAISFTNANFVGSHCGVSIGEDGPSQMGLEDLALFRTIPGSTVFYPSDAVSCSRAVEIAANTKGVCFIRTSRPNTPVIYTSETPFQVGKAHVVKKSGSDQVLIIGAGVTLFEGIEAAETLAKSGIHARVLDPFTVKPLDSAAILANAKECGSKVLVVEDHYPQGGLGEAVAGVCSSAGGSISVKHLAVRELPRSGPPKKLLEKYGIDAFSIVNAVKEILG